MNKKLFMEFNTDDRDKLLVAMLIVLIFAAGLLFSMRNEMHRIKERITSIQWAMDNIPLYK